MLFLMNKREYRALQCFSIALFCSFIVVVWFLSASLAHAAVIQKPPNNLDLVGYWPMNEGRGTSVGDFSTNSNTGSFNGDPQWTNGKQGGGAEFRWE